MSKFQFIYGACITLALDTLLLTTGIGGEIIKSGLVISLLIIFAFAVVVRLMFASATKNDSPTNWKGVVSYTIGSGIVTTVVIVLSLLAIV